MPLGRQLTSPSVNGGTDVDPAEGGGGCGALCKLSSAVPRAKVILRGSVNTQWRWLAGRPPGLADGSGKVPLARAEEEGSSRPTWPPAKFVICCNDGKLLAGSQGSRESWAPLSPISVQRASETCRRRQGAGGKIGPSAPGQPRPVSLHTPPRLTPAMPAGLLLVPTQPSHRQMSGCLDEEPGMGACPHGRGSGLAVTPSLCDLSTSFSRSE